jgi:hypothetical protein
VLGGRSNIDNRIAFRPSIWKYDGSFRLEDNWCSNCFVGRGYDGSHRLSSPELEGWIRSHDIEL